ncbi:(d)CMP kinase [Kingella sp. SNUBH-2017]|jgi:cytidylate kinase|uniref:Cytidylate kinase n=1 Tax=Kingella pumchi TaxID=2779506 RepID=A0ABS9NK94_9NEIS|nr:MULTISPECIES: (d)CMP kinase [Kingella]MCG6502960.1 (d)CMP kinase [Kingella pumchi]MDD2183569.1 (d)CMP kinase [Kingella sp. SNUBH-2017]
MQKVIAIDGPSASGKGTIAARVAQELGWAYLDSGALYRLTALYAQRQGVSWSDEAALAELAAALPVRFAGGTVFLADENVGSAIRSEEIGMGASAVAALPAVRAALLQRQRDFLTEQGLVADGRDMASVVFPQARLKIFLTAAAEVRACRRAKQLGLPCEGLEYQRIVADIQARDLADSRRTSAPLRQEPDAKLLDTSDLSIDETVKKVLDWYRES